jgi:hypothetical protein
LRPLFPPYVMLRNCGKIKKIAAELSENKKFAAEQWENKILLRNCGKIKNFICGIMDTSIFFQSAEQCTLIAEL